MSDLKSSIAEIVSQNVVRVIISKPSSRNNSYRKISAEHTEGIYHVSKYTEKQVFHENIKKEAFRERLNELIEGEFLQVNAWSDDYEFIIMISKKGNVSFKKRWLSNDEVRQKPDKNYNRKKNYLIDEGKEVAPLVDMGIFTSEGKVVNSMYDKFKQINRFVEIIDDEVKSFAADTINVIDFGCGKSYLTFILYYYLTEIKGLKANIIGLDLKADVIEKCNIAAKKYGYTGLRFELGDINGYNVPFNVDMVITLHACDTATDFALYNAIKWNSRMIFSVPCCQHEVNKQIKSERLSALTHFGIVKERFSALATDAIRGELLEYMGYDTQLLEFVDLSHTPKNILIRAVKRGFKSQASKEKNLAELYSLTDEFCIDQTLMRLLLRDGLLKEKNDFVKIGLNKQ